MKKMMISVLMAVCTLPSVAQNGFLQPNKLAVEVGYVLMHDGLNQDDYLSDKFVGRFSNSDYYSLNGVNLKFIVQTKNENLDLFFGTIFLRSRTEVISNMSDFTQNGGGVYVGISPKFKRKHFGLTSDFAVGILTFKRYQHAYQQHPISTIDGHETKASYGLGALSSVGFYVSKGRFSLNPSFMMIFSGGANASFTFYGFNVPLSIRLDKK